MMNKLVRNSKLFLKRNSATILTGVGVLGVIATAVASVKATPRALQLIEEAKEEKEDHLTKWETVKIAAPSYIPAIGIGVGTIACIVGANVLNKRQQAALMSAYALVSKSYTDYKKKVEDMLGEDGQNEIKIALAKDAYDEPIILDEGEELFYDLFSERYFNSTLYEVQQAEYRMNRDIQMQGSVSLNEFYEYLDLDPVEGGDVLGWSEGGNFARYWQSWVDFNHHKTVMDDGLECIIVDFFAEPYLEFEQYS